jgi:hypothetical protein
MAIGVHDTEVYLECAGNNGVSPWNTVSIMDTLILRHSFVFMQDVEKTVVSCSGQ